MVIEIYMTKNQKFAMYTIGYIILIGFIIMAMFAGVSVGLSAATQTDAFTGI